MVFQIGGKMKRYLVAACVFFISSCTTENRKQSIKDTSVLLKEITDGYYQERMHYFPLEATANSDNRYNDLLPIDISDAYIDTLRQFYHRYSEKLLTINKPELTGQDLISYEVLQYTLEIEEKGLRFHSNLMPVNQFWGMHLTFSQLGSGNGSQPFKTVKDYDDFLKRISAFVAYQDTSISNMKRGMLQGVVPPRILIERTIPQYKSLIASKVEESVFYGPIKNMPDSFSDADKKRLTDVYSKAILQELNPSFEKMAVFLEKVYLPACLTVAGISNIPEGREYYTWLANKWTTTTMTPDEIYNVGLKEVERLHSEMDKIKTETGFKGSLKEFFHFIHTDSQFFPFKKDSDVINAYLAIEDRMKPQLKKLFNHVPKAAFEVRQTEAYRAASASAEYNTAAPDGSRPGVFYVPILDATKYNVVGMEDLFLHEAIPGHHYQISLQQENTSLPEFRRFGWFGAYGEGWALYTESLGKELGLYTDPYQYFGSLSEEMHRAIRLVVDVGIHLKGWSREKAIQYSLDNEMESEADITAEIERYMAIPGQALSYKIGQLKIIELRHKAEKELKDKFNIQKFHDQLLSYGCLPLSVLEKSIDLWIKEQKKQG